MGLVNQVLEKVILTMTLNNKKFNISDVYNSSFSSSKDTENLTKELKRALGLESNYQVVKLAMGVSMSLDSFPKINKSGASNNIIKGHILFGKEELPLWVGLLITNYLYHHPDEENNVSITMLQLSVRTHWDNGVKIMNEIWQNCNKDENQFWTNILKKYAHLPESTISNDTITDKYKPLSGAIRLALGHIVDHNEKTFEHILNGQGYSPHIAIMGQAGSGKTQILTQILCQIREQANCPIILVDLGKGDLANRSDLIQKFQAKVISVPESPIPLDMFHVADINNKQQTTAAMENFRDAFIQITDKLGAKQKDNIAKSLLPLFRSKYKISFNDIKNTIETYYSNNNISIDTVISTINSLTLHHLFDPIFSPNEFFKKSWIITFANARTEIKKFSVCLLLSALDCYLKQQPESPLDENSYRNINLIFAVDEARELLNMNHDGLANNIRLHRSKGLSVILVSQSPDDYDGRRDDYLENIGLPICLKTNAASTRTLKNMFKGNISFSNLQPGTCYTVDVINSKPIKIQIEFKKL